MYKGRMITAGEMLKMSRTAFIGAGHITELLINNLLRNSVPKESITAADPDAARRSHIAEKFGTAETASNAEAVKGADIIFICVHPQIVGPVLDDIKDVDLTGRIFISVSAGVPMARYEERYPDIKVIRILPNPPSAIGEGAVPVAPNRNVRAEDLLRAKPLIETFGPCFMVSEDKIDIFTSVTSPAPVLTFFESMIDAALLCGLDNETASAMVQQTIRGCLRMWENNKDIKSIITQACTPAGTSVESLRVMDQMNFRAAVKESYYAAWQKSKGFSGK